MPDYSLRLSIGLLLTAQCMFAQGTPADALHTVPIFTGSFVTRGKHYSYVMAGRNPGSGGTTTIPTVLIPVSFSFHARGGQDGHGQTISAEGAVAEVLESPIFRSFAFATGKTQYGDAVQRAEFYSAATKTGWHTLLGTPQVAPAIQIEIPAADGYLLHSERTGKSLGILDLDFLQKQLFDHLRSIGAGPDKLVIALTRNVAFYSLGDATVCCSVGAHGAKVDPSGKSAQAFVIGSYFDEGVMPRYTDIQGISQQIAEWMNDPLYGYRTNEYPAWLEPLLNAGCGGKGESSAYLLEQPTDYRPGSYSTHMAAGGREYHLENMALLPWFTQNTALDTFHGTYTFPDTKALPVPAQACSSDRNRSAERSVCAAGSNRKGERARAHRVLGGLRFG